MCRPRCRLARPASDVDCVFIRLCPCVCDKPHHKRASDRNPLTGTDATSSHPAKLDESACADASYGLSKDMASDSAERRGCCLDVVEIRVADEKDLGVLWLNGFHTQRSRTMTATAASALLVMLLMTTSSGMRSNFPILAKSACRYRKSVARMNV